MTCHARSPKLFPVTLYLVRHAHAGDRSAWHGDDGERPLSTKGRAQAAALLDRYRSRPITRILSSPSVRCGETVAPLASHLGLEIAICAPLDEGSPADEGIALLRSLAAEEAMLCSHGDVIPAIMGILAAGGLSLDRDGRTSASKAATFEIETDGRDLLRASYRPPPDKMVTPG